MKFTMGGLLTLLPLGFCNAQIPAAFESASIRLSPPGETRSSYDTNAGKISIYNKSLKDCIRLAYGVKIAQLSGGPKWVESERFDIEAKTKRPVGDPQLMAMLQALLKERFKLDIHRETKMVPGYAITVLKSGLKIREVEPGAGHVDARRGSLGAQRTSMVQFAQTLSEVLGAPVIDATATPGVFDFRLDWTPEASRPGLSTDDPEPSALPNMPAGPSLFAAIQEQLGLKLEARKAPLEVLIINRAERPVIE
jgi:uncharacterized protein (TIGR03435 family)